MAGKHAKRTTVKRLPSDAERWRIHFATFDRPATTIVGDRDLALDIAHRFEKIKARARFIEANRGTQGVG